MAKTTDELFQEREKRFSQAIELKIPDRIPMEVAFGYFPAKYAGITCEAAYYDYDVWLGACKKTLADFGEDFSRVQPFFPGKVLELLDVKPLTWPGHGCSPEHSHQYIDIEAMRPDEYDVFLKDPTDFTLRHYLPRVAGALEPFSRLPVLNSTGFGYHNAILVAEELSKPEIAASIAKLLRVGEEMRKWRPRIASFTREINNLGFPSYTPLRAACPFDVISDHLRGMRGSMLDLYRKPDKLIEACNVILERMVNRMKPASPGSNTRVGIPLHRGSEGFMSIKQFETFYWPTLKGLIQNLADKGYIVCVAFEGDYTSRLEYLLELPKGKVLGHFDTTDMVKAKAVLAGHMCISGNVPASLMQTGTPEDVKEYCKRLIDVCGKDGGFIMAARSPMDDARPDTLKTFVDFTVEYGVYR